MVVKSQDARSKLMRVIKVYIMYIERENVERIRK